MNRYRQWSRSLVSPPSGANANANVNVHATAASRDDCSLLLHGVSFPLNRPHGMKTGRDSAFITRTCPWGVYLPNVSGDFLPVKKVPGC